MSNENKPRIFKQKLPNIESNDGFLTNFRNCFKTFFDWSERFFAESKLRIKIIQQINSQAGEKQKKYISALDSNLPSSEYKSKKKAIYKRYPLFYEFTLQQLPIFCLANSTFIGILLNKNKGRMNMVLGGIMGFSGMYLFYFLVIERLCVNKRALSNEKYGHFIRQTFIKEFPNSKKAEIYRNYEAKQILKLKQNS